jgi:hypothetical protein
MTKQEQARDKRLRKTYGWTLEMYNRLFEIQDGKCGACGRPPKPGGMPLNLDHRHVHITVRRILPGGFVETIGDPSELEIPTDARWFATIQEFPDIIVFGHKKKETWQKARELALPRSVRGLLCAGRYAGCNRLLGRIDKSELLQQFLDYLADPPAKKVYKYGNYRGLYT